MGRLSDRDETISLKTMQGEQTWTIRRIILTVLSLIVSLIISSALFKSWSEPQVQGKLNLYQSNILLQGSTLSDGDPTVNLPPAIYDSLVGKEALNTAKTQYQEARTTARDTVDDLHQQLQQIDKSTPTATVKQALTETLHTANQSLQEFNLDLGLIQAVQKQPIAAQQLWQQIGRDLPESSIATTAEVLNQLWSNEKTIPATAEATINQNLQGWFRYEALQQLYTKQADTNKLKNLQSQQRGAAMTAISRLASITIIRGGCVLLGLGLGLWLAIQQLWQQRSKLVPPMTGALVPVRSNILGQVINDGLPIVPWSWETIWQVLLGFFVIGQLLLPQLLGIFAGLSGWSPKQGSLLASAIFVLVSYLLLAGLVTGFLWLSLLSYRPLPPGWFSFRGYKNWLWWGIGGYLVATPIVLLVSVVNDRLWQGKGGSNPILSIVLENKDNLAFLLFFLTAAVAAPVFEEYLFRGFLFPSLTRYMSVWPAIFLSGLIFAVAHLSVSEIIPLAVLGSILSYVYYRTGNLLASMLIHSLWNGGSLLTLYLLAN
jgi:uncharacterized protein